MSAASDDFFSDTAMIAIGCALQGHEFCWLLNKEFDLNFVRQPDMDVEYRPNKKSCYYFSVYQYHIPHSSCEYNLFKLKNDKKTLLPEIGQLDYMWLIKSQTAEHDAHLLADEIKGMNEVQLAKILPAEELKNLNHLLL